MASVSQSITNLLGGVSQQPDPIKLPGQVREALNVYLDPTFGAKKRPPTVFTGVLASDVPADARWFPIFRDSKEHYIACYYIVSGVTTFRVWDAMTGTERTVNKGPSVDAYFDTTDLNNISHLSLQDYTLLANSERQVAMGSSTAPAANQEALVIINSVAYNTNYSVDLSGDSSSTPTKVFKAKKLEVTPGSFEVADGGFCSEQSAEDHTVDSDDSTKTGLSFRLVVQCSAFLQSGSYRSKYVVDVVLRNGGSGWRTGDTVTVTQEGRDYEIEVTDDSFTLVYNDQGTATYVAPSNSEGGSLDVGDVVAGLQTSINEITDYEAEYVGNVLKIKRTDNANFNLGVRGGTTNQAMQAIKGIATDIAALPGQCFDGFRLKVNNTESSDADDYYVIFEPLTPGIPGAGSWVETVKEGLKTDFNKSTMPHALIRKSDGNFDLKAMDDTVALGGWKSRDVGDDTTNPTPTFVGKGVSNMFFYANRLGFLCEDSVVMSQPGDYFNFFITSAIAISDADPIDMTAAADQPAFLKSAKGTPKGVLLFAENAQFLLGSEEVLFSPNTVKINEISDYNVQNNVEPQSTGISVLFISEASTYSKVFEMAVDSVDNRPQVAEVTRIIPEYIPPGLKWATSSPNNSFLMFGDGSDTVYVFKFFNQGTERVQAGWGRWTFPTNVAMAGFTNDTGYFVLYDPATTTYTLSEMSIQDNPTTAPINAAIGRFTPRLDMITEKKDLTVTGYDLNNDKVEITDKSFIAGNQMVFIATDGNSAGTFRREDIVNISGKDYVIAEKSLTSANFILGTEYKMEIELPSFFVTRENKADRIDTPVVEFAYIDLYESSSYNVKLQAIGYDDVDYEITVPLANTYVANTVPSLEILTKSVPVFHPGDVARITVKADDPLPAALTGYSWQGHYNKRGIQTI